MKSPGKSPGSPGSQNPPFLDENRGRQPHDPPWESWILLSHFSSGVNPSKLKYRKNSRNKNVETSGMQVETHWKQQVFEIGCSTFGPRFVWHHLDHFVNTLQTLDSWFGTHHSGNWTTLQVFKNPFAVRPKKTGRSVSNFGPPGLQLWPEILVISTNNTPFIQGGAPVR